jgi:aerobic carbon-monoxide dehydrogenase medium subunit
VPVAAGPAAATMKPAPLAYLRAESPAEAIDALERFAGTARLLAGGQSLVPLLSMRLLRPAAVIDVNPIPGLDRVTVEADSDAVTIGALARYSALERSAVVQDRVPLLARALPFVGDRQVRNRGTLGGALCHADPSGEMALCAVTLGAVLRVRGPRRTREVAAGDFFQGPYTTALAPAEMLVEVSLPAGMGTVATVVEHARRHGDFAVVSVAAVGAPGEDDTWRWLRIGLGAVADRPVYAREASEMLAGRRLDAEAIRAAGQAALAVADPATDVRASAEYRRHLIPIYVERALTALRERRPQRPPP